MSQTALAELYSRIEPGNHTANDYFELIKIMVAKRNEFGPGTEDHLFWQKEIDKVYVLVEDEIRNNQGCPVAQISFGTSGWRGIIGKDVFCKSVAQVTLAIINIYRGLDGPSELTAALGVESMAEAQKKGCVIGHDNRFGGQILARTAADVLTSYGFTVHYASESTTGCLSAAVLEVNAAFSINLTPSHNPLQYAGFKFNAADAGPAAPIITNRITAEARELVDNDETPVLKPDEQLIKPLDALASWKALVSNNIGKHGLDYQKIIEHLSQNTNCVVAVDPMHGATRIHMQQFFSGCDPDRLIFLRNTEDPTFGGIAPEPSPENLRPVMEALAKRPEPLKLGVVLDPDGDRIRFTDGEIEINMNTFGAMAYHYLHEHKNKTGLVAKTVATSNFANAIAKAFGEEVFEPKVGFKEFKPVIDKALVCFEESDGITVIGHTPEKDAYIGLILAIDMMLTLNKNLGAYFQELSEKYGGYYPDKDGITVSQKGDELKRTLAQLDKYEVGTVIRINDEDKTINEIIDIDGLKLIFDDASWLMIRPSGTEPKVRFYVEARSLKDKDGLFAAARILLRDIGLL